jgi:HlyD family secretion protein
MKLRGKWVWLVIFATVVGAALFVTLRPKAIAVIHPTVGRVVQTVVASGQLMPPAEIRIGALVSSTAVEVPVREGDSVRAGQLLLKLDDAEAQASLQQAQANLAAARAGRSELTKLSAPAAEARLIEADAQLAQAKTRLAREKNLFRDGVTTQVALEEAETAAALAQAQRQAADLQVKAASQGGSQAASIAASIASAQAQVALATEKLKRHTILSPSDGVVLARSIEPGDAVLSGASLFVLSATGQTRIRIEPDERNLALLAIEQPAVASAEAFPDQQFEARLQYIAPSVDPQRGTVEVRLVVPEPPDYLRPHMTVSVEIEVAQADSAVLIPRSSLRDEAKDAHVFVIQEGVVRRRPVQLGVRGDHVVAVAGGLNPPDLVVVSPGKDVQEGERRRPSLSPTLPR